MTNVSHVERIASHQLVGHKKNKETGYSFQDFLPVSRIVGNTLAEMSFGSERTSIDEYDVHYYCRHALRVVVVNS